MSFVVVLEIAVSSPLIRVLVVHVRSLVTPSVRRGRISSRPRDVMIIESATKRVKGVSWHRWIKEVSVSVKGWRR